MDIHDLSTQSNLSNANILAILKERYIHGRIYTYINNTLLSINPYRSLGLYTKEALNTYKHSDTSTLEPHVYCISENIYKSLSIHPFQSIIVTGESGSGKTVNISLILKYLKSKMENVNVILEAFGNAETVNNKNSSRFTKEIKLIYWNKALVKAKIRTYLLEKSRITRVKGINEGNFHVFYYILRNEIICNDFIDNKHYASINNAHDHFTSFSSEEDNNDQAINGLEFNSRDVKDKYEELINSFNALGIHNTKMIEDILMGILYLGSLKTYLKEGKVFIDKNIEFYKILKYLSFKEDLFINYLLIKIIKTPHDRIETFNTLEEVIKRRNTLARRMYEDLFNYIVDRINDYLEGNTTDCYNNGEENGSMVFNRGDEYLKKETKGCIVDNFKGYAAEEGNLYILSGHEEGSKDDQLIKFNEYSAKEKSTKDNYKEYSIKEKFSENSAMKKKYEECKSSNTFKEKLTKDYLEEENGSLNKDKFNDVSINHKNKNFINESSPMYSEISLLDIYGFEVFDINTFEQFCINYANEKLNVEFINQTFDKLHMLYEEEGIPYNKSNEYSSGTLGILDEMIKLINEESIRKNSKVNIADKICGYLNDIKRGMGKDSILVDHYAGLVEYMVNEFVEINNENRVAYEELYDLDGDNNMEGNNTLKDTNTPISPRINVIVNNAKCVNNVEDNISMIPEHYAPNSNILGEKYINKQENGIADFIDHIVKQKQEASNTVLKQFTSSLKSLFNTLTRSKIHFIRCIKPNKCQLTDFDDAYILKQLTNSGIIKSIELTKNVHAHNMSIFEFNARYKNIKQDSAVIYGRSKVFFSNKIFNALEKEREMFILACNKMIYDTVVDKFFKDAMKGLIEAHRRHNIISAMKDVNSTHAIKPLKGVSFIDLTKSINSDNSINNINVYSSNMCSGNMCSSNMYSSNMYSSSVCNSTTDCSDTSECISTTVDFIKQDCTTGSFVSESFTTESVYEEDSTMRYYTEQIIGTSENGTGESLLTGNGNILANSIDDNGNILTHATSDNSNILTNTARYANCKGQSIYNGNGNREKKSDKKDALDGGFISQDISFYDDIHYSDERFDNLEIFDKFELPRVNHKGDSIRRAVVQSTYAETINNQNRGGCNMQDENILTLKEKVKNYERFYNLPCKNCKAIEIKYKYQTDELKKINKEVLNTELYKTRISELEKEIQSLREASGKISTVQQFNEVKTTENAIVNTNNVTVSDDDHVGVDKKCISSLSNLKGDLKNKTSEENEIIAGINKVSIQFPVIDDKATFISPHDMFGSMIEIFLEFCPNLSHQEIPKNEMLAFGHIIFQLVVEVNNKRPSASMKIFSTQIREKYSIFERCVTKVAFILNNVIELRSIIASSESIFGQDLNEVYADIDDIVNVLFVHYTEMLKHLITKEITTVLEYQGIKEFHVNQGYFFRLFKKPASLKPTLHVLDFILRIHQYYHFSDLHTEEVFNTVLYTLNARCFNTILTKTNFLCFNRCIQLNYTLNIIDNFIREAGYKDSIYILGHLRDTIKLINYVRANVSINCIIEKCCYLNEVQIMELILRLSKSERDNMRKDVREFKSTKGYKYVGDKKVRVGWNKGVDNEVVIPRFVPGKYVSYILDTLKK